MTYSNDPGTNPPRYPANRTSYVGWVIGGLVALALIIVGVSTYYNKTGTETAVPRPVPTTTGQSTEVPVPGSGQGTAGAPTQTTPPPAR